MRRNRTSRRRFLSQSAATAVGVMAATGLRSTPARAAGANGKFVMGMMGMGIRGPWLLREELCKWPEVEVAYLADVDQGRLEAAGKMVESMTGRRPKLVTDYRRMLDDKSVDVIFNCTPDHWHALATIMACQAGKDVYVEKPASHTPWEGRKMVEAARKYKRVVQLGTQTRSGEYTKAAVEYLRSGKLGHVHLVKVYNLKQRENIGRKPMMPKPDNVDYDMWLGPAPMREFDPNRFHYSWNWYWDYSGGDIINDGVHQIDAARYLIGKKYPKSVYATGGQFFFKNDHECPDTQVVTWDYDDMTLVFEMGLWSPYMKKMPWELRDTDDYPNWPFDGMRIEVYGEKGLMYFERHGGGWQVFDTSEKVIAQKNDRHPHVPHMKNFFKCVQTREKPNADIEEGHLSTLLCQIGNISYRLGGRKLVLDGEKERFVGDDEANAMLKRTYREPWVVPEEV
ncbi:MAG TPA: Gfo/Idh/MocA family oxidoreductase [Phycisphaerae bacterium]|jgi:predicted dehydrogenase|nr:Gfo/Idh/MocA family oxidoreductase [Phycisphaerae bacterium]HOB75477.1 Gfo/Idh/MocA family oxidoreductase [Phycisphaerae bacterium]HOJ55299.1 Gfo/Idh/MocA family oxidoreductase [Phycisphaerae bacterium]HOL27413.1 Gfo/Idh/MocA family oxidoreductase [Phycisphaerae bacterium]HPP21602.1 Gfo/Idh/MocA family oxidoreductase [Phycisphaerae bacterium]